MIFVTRLNTNVAREVMSETRLSRVDSFEQHRHLRAVDFDPRSATTQAFERTAFEALAVQPETVAIPHQQFDSVAPAIEEAEQIAAERILFESRRARSARGRRSPCGNRSARSRRRCEPATEASASLDGEDDARESIDVDAGVHDHAALGARDDLDARRIRTQSSGTGDKFDEVPRCRRIRLGFMSQSPSPVRERRHRNTDSRGQSFVRQAFTLANREPLSSLLSSNHARDRAEAAAPKKMGLAERLPRQHARFSARG
jgi:hypothetical protein